MKSKRLKIAGIIVFVTSTVGALVYMQAMASLRDAESASNADVQLAMAAVDRVICSGRVEAIDGEVDVAAQIAGQLAEVRVREGDRVEEGEVIAVLDASRQTAQLGVAEQSVSVAAAQVSRLERGNGEEEIDEARLASQSLAAQLKYEQSSLNRYRQLLKREAVAPDDFEQKEQRVAHLKLQVESLVKRYEALRRGPLTEEIEVARAELELAKARLRRARVEHEYRVVRAPMSGTILKVYRHAGDTVSLDDFTPIVRIANTENLRIRLEVDELNVPKIAGDQQGTFKVRGVDRTAGTLIVDRMLPAFGPKRLFNPDTSARHDARALDVLCQPDASIPLYPGQRVTAEFEIAPAANTASEEVESPGPANL